MIALAVLASTLCTATTTKALAHRFVVDVNAGRGAAAARLFAPEPAFQWLSAGPPGARAGATARNRATIAAWVRGRARAGDHLMIAKLAAGYDPTRGIVNFAGEIERQGRVKAFKGAATCAYGRPLLIVWSMSRNVVAGHVRSGCRR